MAAKPFAGLVRALFGAVAAGAFTLVIYSALSPASAEENVVLPAEFTSAVAMKRQAYRFQQLESAPKLDNDTLAAYVKRQQALRSFDGFEVAPTGEQLTAAVLTSYIAKRRNDALDAIEAADTTGGPALTATVLASYAEKGFVPTKKRVKLAEGEKLCLAQAIYHEARGESREGQLAVANVIINRAMSKKYPSTICGVVFQNADQGRYRCQFTFACDGRSDMGNEKAAWSRSLKMAEQAFYEFQKGERPGVIPSNALYYHTRAVAPKWSNTFRRVATIGSHIFYATN